MSNHPIGMQFYCAAHFLRISEAKLVALVVRGELPFFRLGNKRRILVNDLVAYNKKHTRRKALAEITNIANREGMYD